MNFGVVHLIVFMMMSFNFISILARYPYEMMVSASVANLVREPGIDHQNKRGPVLSRNVPQLDTQLIFGQHVQVLGECFVGQEAWVKVGALEQKKALFDLDGSFKELIAYPGWMRKKDLEVFVQGSAHGEMQDANQDEKQDVKNIREKIIGDARSFLGSPYVWGGCSEYKIGADYLTGVDCSGLIYMSYRKSAIEIPRDAHDQFIFTREIAPEGVQPGDLIFFGVERERNSKVEVRINHVLMYIGNGLLIEAFAGDPSCSDVDELSQAEKALACIREISLEERLGKSLNDLRNGEFLSKTNTFVYFRSVFSRPEC